MNTHTLQALFAAEFNTKLNLQDVLTFVETRGLHLEMFIPKSVHVDFLCGENLHKLFGSDTLLEDIPAADMLNYICTIWLSSELTQQLRTYRMLMDVLHECKPEELRAALEYAENCE